MLTTHCRHLLDLLISTPLRRIDDNTTNEGCVTVQLDHAFSSCFELLGFQPDLKSKIEFGVTFNAPARLVLTFNGAPPNATRTTSVSLSFSLRMLFTPEFSSGRTHRVCVVTKTSLLFRFVRFAPNAGGLHPGQLQGWRRGHTPPAWTSNDNDNENDIDIAIDTDSDNDNDNNNDNDMDNDKNDHENFETLTKSNCGKPKIPSVFILGVGGSEARARLESQMARDIGLFMLLLAVER